MLYNAMAMIVNFILAEKLPTSPLPPNTQTHTTLTYQKTKIISFD